LVSNQSKLGLNQNQTSGFGFGLEILAIKPNGLVLVWVTSDHPKWFHSWFALSFLAHSSTGQTHGFSLRSVVLQ